MELCTLVRGQRDTDEPIETDDGDSAAALS